MFIHQTDRISSLQYYLKYEISIVFLLCYILIHTLWDRRSVIHLSYIKDDVI